MTPSSFQPKDWVVHKNLGVAQIAKIENRKTGEASRPCFRLELKDKQGTVWVPAKDCHEWLRPIAKPAAFMAVENSLKKASKSLPSDYRSRLGHILEAKSNGRPREIAVLIRDLWARQTQLGKLSRTERQALAELVDKLLSEWAISVGSEKRHMRQKLYQLLRQHALPIRA